MAINAYDDYGIPASTNQGRFQYTGQAWIAELGMYSYKARIYSPTLGRFLQTDPADYPDGPNRYTYVGNDPVNRRDPSGLCQYAGTGSSWFDGGEISVACPQWDDDFGFDDFGFGGGDMSMDTGWLMAELNAVTYDANVRGAQIAGGRQAQNKSNRGCGQHSDFTYGDAALYILNFAGTAADVTSLALAGASVEAGGPTNPVGGALAIGALVANRFSAATSGASIPINLYQGNYRGAAANVAGLVAGHFAADIATKAAGAPPVKGLAKDAANTAASQAASNASGC